MRGSGRDFLESIVLEILRKVILKHLT